MSSQAYANALTAFRHAAREARGLRITGLFDEQPDRLESLSFEAAGIYVDFSRHRLPQSAKPTLAALVQTSELAARRHAMFSGQVINTTEQRAVYHVALRGGDDQPMPVAPDGEDVAPEVAETLAKMRTFSNAVREGQWRGAGGERITDVVHVGIGGSQLGPLLACDALGPPTGPAVHFLANIDPAAFTRIQTDLNPHSTLVIIASKSWRTIETARNGQAVAQWLTAGGINEQDLHHHLVGVTANPQGARDFGLRDDAIFPFRDWVGGRYSLWSAIGLPLMLQSGPACFDAMLAGARQMDEHFQSANWDRNAPVMMALLSMWNADSLGSQTEAVIPYASALARLPAYLQQLQMESNGKSVDIDGQTLSCPPAPVIWGEPGTDAQHSFFQSLHQSAQEQPVDFVLVKQSHNDPQGRAVGLSANAIAQAEALLVGQSNREEPHKHYAGNRPSSTILLDKLDAANFGALIALYEHKTASLGWLMRINSFDQWGVELGKAIASKHEALLNGEAALADAGLNPSIEMLVRKLQLNR